ncbi:MAG: hypothetical protein E7Z92_04015 [Cyanobacteria bacterium SIG31]|nr:hypothetical protein [Cyanobacteria bacterium SIG31]
MKQVFNLTNKYLILLTPLLLYSLFSSVYLAASAVGGKYINMIFAIVLFFFMTGAFIAGWFNMIKLAVANDIREDANSLIKEFPTGVGEYFLSSLGAMLNILVFTIFMLIISFQLGMHFIGDIGISAEAFSKALESTAALKVFVASLTTEQLSKLNSWNLNLLGSMTLTYFLVILYLPAIFFKSKNPFKAILISLKDLFSKNFIRTLGVYSLIFVGNFIISILSAVFTGNVIMHFIVTLANFYFITLAGLGIFYYYYNYFVKLQLGQNIDVKI